MHFTGRAAQGYMDIANDNNLIKVSVTWHREQFEAINRRVVKNNTTFAYEARRLMDMALALDHQEGGFRYVAG